MDSVPMFHRFYYTLSIRVSFTSHSLSPELEQLFHELITLSICGSTRHFPSSRESVLRAWWERPLSWATPRCEWESLGETTRHQSLSLRTDSNLGQGWETQRSYQAFSLKIISTVGLFMTTCPGMQHCVYHRVKVHSELLMLTKPAD